MYRLVRHLGVVTALFAVSQCCDPMLWAQTTPPAGAPPAAATASPGQSDLDEAIQKRFDADTDDDLAEVAALIESAQQKGLDKDNEVMAGEVLGSVRLERAQRMMAEMVRVRGTRALQIRDDVLTQLNAAIAADPALVEAHSNKARLLALSGDRDGARQAASKAVELLAGNPAERSKALVMRAMTQAGINEQLTDLNAAIQSDDGNVEAYQARAALRIKRGEVEAAVADLKKVLEANPGDKMTTAVIVEQLVALDRSDEALDMVDGVIEREPSESMYKLRALLHEKLGDNAAATADLNAALELQPKDPIALLQRAELALNDENVAAAKADLQSAMNMAPQLAGDVKALALKAQIAIVEDRLPDAINTLTTIAEKFPEEPYWALRLATLYSMDKRPRQAIEVLSETLQRDPKNVAILRSLGDAKLSVGDHDAAIEDYEQAIAALGDEDTVKANDELRVEASGLYNNLAWVLSTSTTDAVRNAEKSLKYGTKAAELTDYKEAHILSTLAAAYAENGNFEEAKKWSQKAVDMATEEEHEQLDQLKEELETYERGEPWREKQEQEENNIPLLSPEDLIDT